MLQMNYSTAKHIIQKYRQAQQNMIKPVLPPKQGNTVQILAPTFQSIMQPRNIQIVPISGQYKTVYNQTMAAG